MLIVFVVQHVYNIFLLLPKYIFDLLVNIVMLHILSLLLNPIHIMFHSRMSLIICLIQSSDHGLLFGKTLV